MNTTPKPRAKRTSSVAHRILKETARADLIFYQWEDAIVPIESPPDAMPDKVPSEISALLHSIWSARSHPHLANDGSALQLHLAPELSEVEGGAVVAYSGYTGIARGPHIAFGRRGLTRAVALHEIAHLLINPFLDRHGAEFARTVLTLYVEHLGVDEADALRLAQEMGVIVDAKTPKVQQ